MSGLIISKAANTYADLIQKSNLMLKDYVFFDSADPIQACSTLDLARITWLLAEPNFAFEVLNALPNLKWLQSTWAGVEKLISADLRQDYVLTNIKGVFAPLMTEFVLAHLLAHERQLSSHRMAFLNRSWHNSTTGVIRGKTALLLGVGSIGTGIAKALKFLGLHVFGIMNTPRAMDDLDISGGLSDLPRLLPQADYVINILPNTPATLNICDASFFGHMARHALFINVGRGLAVVDTDLAAALHSGNIAGAILDVYRCEPLPSDHIFWDSPNLTLTSHTAAPSFPEEVFEIFKDNFERFSLGLPLRHVVNFERGY